MGRVCHTGRDITPAAAHPGAARPEATDGVGAGEEDVFDRRGRGRFAGSSAHGVMPPTASSAWHSVAPEDAAAAGCDGGGSGPVRQNV